MIYYIRLADGSYHGFSGPVPSVHKARQWYSPEKAQMIAKQLQDDGIPCSVMSITEAQLDNPNVVRK